MENQHRKIIGYRELDSEEIKVINDIKSIGIDLKDLIQRLHEMNSADHRWISIGQTQLQQGIMALVRSVAKPESF